MAISGRGLRRILVDGVPYRWKLPRRLTESQQDGWPGIMVLVLSAEPARAVLRLVFAQRHHPDGGCGHLGTPVLPSDVAAGIRKALTAGWQPQQRASSFTLRIVEPKAEPDA